MTIRHLICVCALALSASASASDSFTSTGHSAGPSLGPYPLIITYAGEERIVEAAHVAWTITGGMSGDAVTFDSITASVIASDCPIGPVYIDCTYINVSGSLQGSLGVASSVEDGSIMFPSMSGSVTFGDGVWEYVYVESPGSMSARYTPGHDASLLVRGNPVWSSGHELYPVQSLLVPTLRGSGAITSVPEPRSWVMMLLAVSCTACYRLSLKGMSWSR